MLRILYDGLRPLQLYGWQNHGDAFSGFDGAFGLETKAVES